MGIKEIITYSFFVIGLGLVCASKVKFQQRQKVTPDNAYSNSEKMMLRSGYCILAFAFVLACIPVY